MMIYIDDRRRTTMAVPIPRRLLPVRKQQKSTVFKSENRVIPVRNDWGFRGQVFGQRVGTYKRDSMPIDYFVL
jgi:hypothetical protein